MQAELWELIRQKLKEFLPSHTFSSFVESASCLANTDDNLALSFPDNFSKEGFAEKCLPTLQETLNLLKLKEIAVALSVLQQNSISSVPSTTLPQDRCPFDSKYKFDTFVVGTSNQFAHAACHAVAKQPGQCYNPLFIFGAAGLGKTHLLKAIGYEIYQQNPEMKVLFVTSESFTNELIHAIRQDRMRDFREKYRTGCDVLLLDDVHFLAGRERTQEEFFYTFNYLHESRKQIVITSDRYPRDIKGLENRLQTRFEWGLVADVQPPEVETRIAILQNKADEQNILLPNDVAQYIASHITTNIRELEGSLHRLQAYALLSAVPISIQLAQQILKDIVPRITHEVTPAGILNVVAVHFSVKIQDLKSDKRIRSLSFPRQICMYLLRTRLALPLKEIGKFMGGKDHSTVLHAVHKIANELKTNPEVENHLAKLEGLMR